MPHFVRKHLRINNNSTALLAYRHVEALPSILFDVRSRKSHLVTALPGPRGCGCRTEHSALDGAVDLRALFNCRYLGSLALF